MSVLPPNNIFNSSAYSRVTSVPAHDTIPQIQDEQTLRERPISWVSDYMQYKGLSFDHIRLDENGHHIIRLRHIPGSEGEDAFTLPDDVARFLRFFKAFGCEIVEGYRTEDDDDPDTVLDIYCSPAYEPSSAWQDQVLNFPYMMPELYVDGEIINVPFHFHSLSEADTRVPYIMDERGRNFPFMFYLLCGSLIYSGDFTPTIKVVWNPQLDLPNRNEIMRRARMLMVFFATSTNISISDRGVVIEINGHYFASSRGNHVYDVRAVQALVDRVYFRTHFDDSGPSPWLLLGKICHILGENRARVDTRFGYSEVVNDEALLIETERESGDHVIYHHEIVALLDTLDSMNSCLIFRGEQPGDSQSRRFLFNFVEWEGVRAAEEGGYLHLLNTFGQPVRFRSVFDSVSSACYFICTRNEPQRNPWQGTIRVRGESGEGFYTDRGSEPVHPYLQGRLRRSRQQPPSSPRQQRLQRTVKVIVVDLPDDVVEEQIVVNKQEGKGDSLF